jgi:hypothetical protein
LKEKKLKDKKYLSNFWQIFEGKRQFKLFQGCAERTMKDNRNIDNLSSSQKDNHN